MKVRTLRWIMMMRHEADAAAEGEGVRKILGDVWQWQMHCFSSSSERKFTFLDGRSFRKPKKRIDIAWFSVVILNIEKSNNFLSFCLLDFNLESSNLSIVRGESRIRTLRLLIN
jgi:hypothetical protein